ncbi:MAG: hypothetical protein ABIH82_00210 [Candidatus Woesearchaeota archaeon]
MVVERERTSRLVMLALGTGLALATACSPKNQAACKDYVGSYNGLVCVIDSGKLDEKNYCSDTLDGGCDITKWYECMADAHFCENDGHGKTVPNTTAYAACGSYAVCR